LTSQEDTILSAGAGAGVAHSAISHANSGDVLDVTFKAKGARRGG
jgi:hypothetical protein